MFFTFYQNNSGGSYRLNQDLAPVVIVEAQTPEAANEIALRLGIYFDGVREGKDCRCCGDRWDMAGDGTEHPTMWGDPLDENSNDYIIHYLDGSRVDSRLRATVGDRPKEFVDDE